MSLFSDPEATYDGGYTGSLNMAQEHHSTGCWFALPALGCLGGAMWMLISGNIIAVSEFF